jgi:UDP:flavonoid glycosyltransferase YjiC (YdhE family)
VYCEPPEFLTVAERQTFEPVAFFGSIQPGEGEPDSVGDQLSAFGNASPNELKVYISFGTVIWRHFAEEALAAVRTIAETVATIEDVRAVISLGGRLEADRVAVRQPNVSIAHYVDQWRILQATDLFVTHHGLNSTHEGIFHGVPMVSYPFFGDQPGLAKRCQDLGLAIPLTSALRGKVDQQDVERAFAVFRDQREAFRIHLAAAREWEMKVIEGRGAVLDRLTALIGTRGRG